MITCLNEEQIQWVYRKWCVGYTKEEIADALHVCRKTLGRALKGKTKIRPKLTYDE